MIKVILPKRGADTYGSGAFGAPRGERTHKGIDFACAAGAEVFTPVDGHVTKLGYPYADTVEYRYVEITSQAGLRHRLFYVKPSVIVGQFVNKDVTIIGVAQDIAARYSPGMKNHVHYEILLMNGQPVDPEGGKA